MAAPRIFVSHSHANNEWCRAFVPVLQAAGWDVWYDEKGLGAGAEWVKVIQDELQAREIFLLVLTPNAWESKWVQEEVNLALVTHRQIITVLHQETPDVRGFLLSRQCVRVVGLSGAEAAHQVLGAMAQSIAVTPAPAPVHSPGAPPPSAPTLPPLGPAPAPTGATSAHHLTPMPLYNLGFRGYTVKGTECILPPLCPVPGGLFTMGSDKSKDAQAYDDEMPQYPIEVGPFAIGQYPVTVAEYACAVRAKAVREPPDSGAVTWQQQLTRLNHPVVCVSWQDVAAYVSWLARTTGSQPWRLPTEAEWEKAARWDAQRQASRIYPWGETFDQARCNTSEGKKGTTTPVGSYPTGASPYGAQDMAGNVWEWTSSLFKPYPYISTDGREVLDSIENRVLRGGSWGYNARDARAAYRSFVARPVSINNNRGSVWCWRCRLVHNS